MPRTYPISKYTFCGVTLLESRWERTDHWTIRWSMCSGMISCLEPKIYFISFKQPRVIMFGLEGSGKTSILYRIKNLQQKTDGDDSSNKSPIGERTMNHQRQTNHSNSNDNDDNNNNNRNSDYEMEIPAPTIGANFVSLEMDIDSMNDGCSVIELGQSLPSPQVEEEKKSTFFTKLKEIWVCQQPKPDAILFVVDAASSDGEIRHAREELHEIFDNLVGSFSTEGRNVPVLIFANKQDSPNARDGDAITQQLELNHSMMSRWHVQECSVATGDGLLHGWNWTVNQFRRSSAQRDRSIDLFWASISFCKNLLHKYMTSKLKPHRSDETEKTILQPAYDNGIMIV